MPAPDPRSDAYHARRRRKERRTRAVAFVLVALFFLGLLGGTVWPPISSWLQARELARLAALPYPDPHPDQTALLTFTEHLGGINIRTDWLPIHAVHDDHGQPSGFIVMRLTTRLDPVPRAPPPSPIGGADGRGPG